MSDRRILAGRYEVRALLGRGGMAEVHEGLDTRLGRSIAIKLLRSDLARDPSFQARLRREAQSAAALNHPSIVAVYDSGEEVLHESGGGEVHVPFIVMEYVRGHTLRDLLKSEGQLPVDQAVHAAAGVLSALQYSHRAGIVHRDIKPGNVMITPSDDVKVMDFGIARALADTSATMTQTSAVVGTAQYLSPEQARGEVVDARSDLYSAACLLFELLTGRPPFVGDSPVAVAYQHVREEPDAPSVHNDDVPPAIDRVLMHALAKERGDRYQDAGTFRADLLAAQGGRPLSIDGPDDDSTTVMGAAAPAPTEAMTQAMGAQTAATTVQQTHTPSHRADVAEATGVAAFAGDSPSTAETPVSDGDDEEPPKKHKSAKGWIWFLSILLVLVLGGLGYYVYTLQKPEQPPGFKLDNVTNIDADQAKSILTGRHLKVKETKKKDKSVPKGTVIATKPKPKTIVHRGDVITLVVSSGPKSVTVPDVDGQTETYARQLLEQSNLVAGSDSEDYSPSLEKGKVLRSNPRAGKKVDGGSTVDLVLSNGQVRVPGVVGEKKKHACHILESSDYQLSCDVTTRVSDPDKYPAGTVVKQSTSQGEAVPQHSTITITVAVPPEKPTNSPTNSPTESPTESPTTSPTESPTDPATTSPPDDGGKGDGE
ncbi:Stk1 family PASTA domain-containing Ser/Thr kinase [Spelaeicoccus albus]|uniref:non-specific serine/threonine protein kinase n=1 Tax=Spelaeicoccus albus TaxID=1280376 RepID=A0A7Z0A903_9MICO|nr:Stk1 family PASTA domain-containing Ser/Thr kinase [Spelaeicoccus albus]NYI66607.1 serine/threonine-protein kinase [Spelaeicoccus albus]